MRALIRLLQVLATLAILSPGTGYANTVYRFDAIEGTGDTVAISDINDRGDIVYAGFGDVGGRSYVQWGATYLGSQAPQLGWPLAESVPGLDPSWGGTGVEVYAIDNQGNLQGTWTNPNTGNRIPVIWNGMIPYDMADPVNAGAIFLGSVSKYVPQEFFSDVTIIGMPYREYWIGDGRANALGEIVIHFGSAAGMDQYGLLTLIPEPNSVALFGIALLASIPSVRKRE